MCYIERNEGLKHRSKFAGSEILPTFKGFKKPSDLLCTMLSRRSSMTVDQFGLLSVVGECHTKISNNPCRTNYGSLCQ